MKIYDTKTKKKKLIVINYTVFFILMIIKYISVIN